METRNTNTFYLEPGTRNFLKLNQVVNQQNMTYANLF